MEMFDVTGEMIGKLRDDDLRSLVGLLCETEYRMEGLPTRGIMWGGNQDAKDGGLDVVVKDTVDPPKNSWILRPYTGFQVKKPSMPPAKITSEMKPKGQLRDVIKELIRNKGAYILISSEDSCTNEFLQLRLDKMKEAIADVPNSEQLHIDFLDSDRLATWVRTYPSLILWVKEKIKTTTYGWKPFGNWSLPPNNSEDSYLHNDVPIFSLRIGNLMQHLTAVQTIAHLRTELSNKNAFIRLVGLSGVGKTRFVTALFDKTIGENALNTGAVVYTDLSEETIPSPTQLADQLIINKQDIILIIDNCPPNVHKQIVEKCRATNCAIKLLSIEYDVRDDLPEETDVIIMEPSGQSLIQELIRKRHPHISIVDAETISEFSGGNYRIAIALANTINRGDSIGHLRDEELFQRLFHQKNEKDRNLLHIASVLSLVYSFEKTETEDSELHILASIANVSFSEVYRCVGILESRNLIQSRGHWRAVLPHAIANRLAKQALNELPINQILKHIIDPKRERLLLSFTRRLGYLHDVDKAQKIVGDWLKPDGMIGGTNGYMPQLQKRTLLNTTPVSPEAALSLIQYWVSLSGFWEIESNNCIEYVTILRDIAYNSDLFIGSVKLMCEFVLNDKRKEIFSIRYTQSLFTLYLSGTNALPEQRSQIIEWLWNQESETSTDLAISLLDQTFIASDFTSYRNYQMGANKRDYGWEPKSESDVLRWYHTFLNLSLSFATSEGKFSGKAKKLIAKSFRGLWVHTQCQDMLVSAFRKIAEDEFWTDGWLYVREVIKYDSQRVPQSSLHQLTLLEKEIRPKNLYDNTLCYIISTQDLQNLLTTIELDNKGNETLNEICIDIGHQLAQDFVLLSSLLPMILTSQNRTGTYFCGRGLAEKATNKFELWKTFEQHVTLVDSNTLNISILRGVLSSPAIDSEREKIIESTINHPLLRTHTVSFQLASNLTFDAFNRIIYCLDNSISPLDDYKYIFDRPNYSNEFDNKVTECIQKILYKDEGIFLAVNLAYLRLIRCKQEISPAMNDAMQKIILEYPYNSIHNGESCHTLSIIAKKCFNQPNSVDRFAKICRIIANVVMSEYGYISKYHELVKALASSLFPNIFLNEFLLNPNSKKNKRIFGYEDSPLKGIKDETLIKWCETAPARRYPLLLASISIYKGSRRAEFLEYNQFALKILELAPNTNEVLDIFAQNIYPIVYINSRAAEIERRAENIKTLFSHSNKQIESWAKKTHSEMLTAAKKARQLEESGNRYDRFE